MPRLFTRSHADPITLSYDEGTVLYLIAKGYSHEQISCLMNVDAGAVLEHERRVFRSLRVHSRLAAALWAIKTRWVHQFSIAAEPIDTPSHNTGNATA